jgi:hypothetical protein
MVAEKIEAFWEDATAGDVAGIANARKLIPARVRDKDDEAWLEVLLAGWKLRGLSGARWIDSDGSTWNLCQVYREPSWWLDKPDPGPGWRLLGKLPDEELKPGDECFTSTGVWDQSFSATIGERQSYGMWYRRRIEAVEFEPKHYILRVGDTVEGPKGDCIRCVEPGFEQSHYELKAGDTVGTPNGQTITITAKGFEVAQ